MHAQRVCKTNSTRFFLVIGEDWGVALSVSKTRNIDAALPDLFNLDGINV